ncbi:hypothetical protein X798_06845 [Onchocerca flexuosa]|uniref:7TM_GPCR_Srx domain-containing protein n=1 Tax=Onchocerca flexuosa TaxID=387005 RepID=A0A238BL41_9BILA|nr:hypothetical protein X798_06845 [Onchocerca flexuosa]
MYIAIFYSIRRKRHAISDISHAQRMNAGSASNIASTGSYERVMLIQAALICGALESTVLISNFLSFLVLKIFGQKAIISLGIFINCYAISSRAALPTIAVELSSFGILQKNEQPNKMYDLLDPNSHLATVRTILIIAFLPSN